MRLFLTISFLFVSLLICGQIPKGCNLDPKHLVGLPHATDKQLKDILGPCAIDQGIRENKTRSGKAVHYRLYTRMIDKKRTDFPNFINFQIRSGSNWADIETSDRLVFIEYVESLKNFGFKYSKALSGENYNVYEKNSTYFPYKILTENYLYNQKFTVYRISIGLPQ